MILRIGTASGKQAAEHILVRGNLLPALVHGKGPSMLPFITYPLDFSLMSSSETTESKREVRDGSRFCSVISCPHEMLNLESEMFKGVETAFGIEGRASGAIGTGVGTAQLMG